MKRLLKNIQDGNEISGKMIENPQAPSYFIAGLKQSINETVPGCLNWGCLPIAFGTGFVLYQEIRSGAVDHIFPTCAAALILLGLGPALQKIKHKINPPQE